MSFIASKFIWWLLAPTTLLFLALVLAWLLLNKAPKLSCTLLGLCCAFLALLLLTPIGSAAIASLEYRFARPVLEGQTIDGIIILGGAIDPTASRRTGTIVINNAGERLTEWLALARRYPKARQIFTGGSGSVRSDDREADVAVEFLKQQGFDPTRVVFERNSRNTYENAVESKKLMIPKPGEHWLLITSAFHMPRAVGCFRTVSWDVTPYPVDFNAASSDEWLHFNTNEQLSLLSTAIREYVGLTSYKLMGRISELFPAP